MGHNPSSSMAPLSPVTAAEASDVLSHIHLQRVPVVWIICWLGYRTTPHFLISSLKCLTCLKGLLIEHFWCIINDFINYAIVTYSADLWYIIVHLSYLTVCLAARVVYRCNELLTISEHCEFIQEAITNTRN